MPSSCAKPLPSSCAKPLPSSCAMLPYGNSNSLASLHHIFVTLVVSMHFTLATVEPPINPLPHSAFHRRTHTLTHLPSHIRRHNTDRRGLKPATAEVFTPVLPSNVFIKATTPLSLKSLDSLRRFLSCKW